MHRAHLLDHRPPLGVGGYKRARSFVEDTIDHLPEFKRPVDERPIGMRPLRPNGGFITTVSHASPAQSISGFLMSATMKATVTPSISAFRRAISIAAGSISTPVTADAPRRAAPQARTRSRTRDHRPGAPRSPPAWRHGGGGGPPPAPGSGTARGRSSAGQNPAGAPTASRGDEGSW